MSKLEPSQSVRASYIVTGSVLAFAILYLIAARVSPAFAGARPGAGFGFIHGYWCDLLNATTPSGRSNPSRPFALAATMVLSLGLAVHWWNVPVLYLDAPRRAKVVRYLGAISGIATPLIATRLHDLIVSFAGLLGMTAFLVTITAWKDRTRVVTLLSWWVLALTLANYFVWSTRLGIGALPVLQKAAILAFLAWVTLVASAYRQRAAAAT